MVRTCSIHKNNIDCNEKCQKQELDPKPLLLTYDVRARSPSIIALQDAAVVVYTLIDHDAYSCWSRELAIVVN